ncbi:hypothetical protein ACUKBL_02675 [Furfurilactobacillus rossiae]
MNIKKISIQTLITIILLAPLTFALTTFTFVSVPFIAAILIMVSLTASIIGVWTLAGQLAKAITKDNNHD